MFEILDYYRQASLVSTRGFVCRMGARALPVVGLLLGALALRFVGRWVSSSCNRAGKKRFI
jgi:hypothetical protein